ncbi:hypothetical protein K1T71_006072 [Dendrolimus kikuchii]|uniref:Uncharacterized protein n=1 Tax=Dendrolimus kikuchii TaxID=765133 RepID=A0ACC1D2R0_9NEOP|nr:hypothetical protein K1T71_006072 [Dendrolimus kikuchii]
MNILPKKRWHVRTKENIARVRRDEAQAADKDRQEKLRIEKADREARLNVLKQKSKDRLLHSNISKPEDQRDEHINLFEDLDNAIETTNKEHDQDIKNKQEEYEKKIGYLTYLGQDTNEAIGKKNWYEVLPSTRLAQDNDIKDTYDKLVLKDADGKPKKKQVDEKDGEIAWNAKQHLDPINSFKKYCYNIEKNHTKVSSVKSKINEYNPKIKEKHNKKHKESKGEKIVKLQKLREARLKRERQEKYKTDLFLGNLKDPCTSTSSLEKSVNKIKPKYNSQFNPELARQNYR